MFALNIQPATVIFAVVVLQILCLVGIVACFRVIKGLDYDGPSDIFLKEKKKQETGTPFVDIYQECFDGPTEDSRVETVGGQAT